MHDEHVIPPTFDPVPDRVEPGREMAALIGEKDWSATALGARDRWPATLTVLVNAILQQPFPMAIIWGPHSEIVYNDAFRRFSVSLPPDALGQPITTLWPQLRAVLLPIIRRLHRGESVWLEDHPFALSTGGTRRVTVGCSAIADDVGRVSGALAVVQAASQSRETDHDANSAARLNPAVEAERLAREAAQSGWWHYDHATGQVFWDERLRQMMGAESGDHDLESAIRHIHPDDRERVTETLRKALSANPNVPYRIEYRFLVPRTGEVRWVESVGRVMFEGDGAARRGVAVYGTATDITARKTAESAVDELAGQLASQERLFSTALSHIADFVYVLNLRGEFVYANEPLLKLLGQTAPDVIGRRVDQTRFPHEWAERLLNQVARVAKNGRGVSEEVTSQSADGNEEHYVHILNPILSPTGELEAIAGSTHNITERKRAERHTHFLSHLGQRIALIDDAPEILRVAATEIAAELHANGCFICEWDAQLRTVLMRGISPAGRMASSLRDVSELGSPDWWREHTEGNAAVADVCAEPGLAEKIPAYEQLQIRSFASARFKRDGPELVTLMVAADEPREWRADELDLLENVIARVWPLFQRTQEARHGDFLGQLGQTLSLLTDPIEIATITVAEVGRHFGADACFCFESSAPDSDQAAITECWIRKDGDSGKISRGDCRGKTLGAGERWAEVKEHGVVVEDVTRDRRLDGHWFRQLGIGSLMTVPFIREGRWVAGMAVATERARRWDRAELGLFENVMARVWPTIERARAVAESRGHAERLRLALVAADLGDFQFHAKGDRFALSPRAAEMLGLDGVREIAAADLRGMMHEEDRKREQAAANHALVTHAEYNVEFRYRNRSGEWRWMAARGRGTYASTGEATGMLGVFQDITDRKRNEVELETARDRAVAASRAKDAFLATLSHELRTPLNPVLLLASDAEADESLPASVRERFAIVRHNIELEARLIDDLLDLTRISRGLLALNIQPQDAHGLLKNAIETMQGLIVEKSIRLVVKMDAPEAIVLGDAVRLQQVFWNVLNNAVKFTPDCGRIEISTGITTEKRQLRVEVRDNGIGLTPGELSRAFDAFAQGDHATGSSEHRFGGVGLGLSISRMLVEQHGGQIHAASEGRGQGAVFSVELPLATGVRLPAGPAENGGSRATASSKGSRGRVLLVEDHAPTRSALATLLRRRNFSVLTAASASEARALAERGELKLIISDIGLPDATGYELMEDVSHRFGLKGIALTGYGSEEDIERSRQAGFDAHLTKPVTVQALDRALAAIGGERDDASPNQ